MYAIRSYYDIGDESRTDPLNLVRPRRKRFPPQCLRDDGAVNGFDRHGQKRLPLRFLDVSGNPRDRATRSDAGDEHVDLSLRILPDFRAGRVLVDLRVGIV